MRVETYGEGGFDPAKPNNNVLASEDVADTPVELDQFATLIDDLSKATTLAQVRDAAKAARGKRGR